MRRRLREDRVRIIMIPEGMSTGWFASSLEVHLVILFVYFRASNPFTYVLALLET